jgi:hypothetical protein
METGTISADQPGKWQKQRQMMLALLLVGGAIWGSLDLLLYGRGFLGRLVSYVCALPIAVAMMLWCVYDGRIRGFHVSGIWRWLIVLIGIVGVPFYFWQSRSHRECFRGVFGLFLFAAVAVPYYFVWYSLGYVLEKIGYYA